LVKKTYDDDDDYDWICSNSPPKDFLTLVRFTVMAKICRNGNLHTRSFIAADGVSILMVIKSNRAVIMKQAESMKITK
jgi:anoctamin-10